MNLLEGLFLKVTNTTDTPQVFKNKNFLGKINDIIMLFIVYNTSFHRTNMDGGLISWSTILFGDNKGRI